MYGHPSCMVTPHVWSPSCMVIPHVWSPLMYGHPSCMVTPHVWSPLMYGHPSCMVTPRVWSPLMYGHPSCMVTPHVWSPLMYGHPSCMVTPHVWSEFSPLALCISLNRSPDHFSIFRYCTSACSLWPLPSSPSRYSDNGDHLIMIQAFNFTLSLS